MLKILHASCGFEMEPLSSPFGFKGKHITVLWQSAVRLEDDQGRVGCAPGVQSVVWSDAEVFSRLGQSGGNAAMYMITACAVEMIKGKQYADPVDMIRQLMEPLYKRAVEITGLTSLRKTFVLNALVPLDLAAWQLYARTIGAATFEELLPKCFWQCLPQRHRQLASIPLISYNVSVDEVARLAAEGAFLLKIKLGCDPDGDGDLQKMLEWDIRRVTQLHEALKNGRTPYTDNGKLAYYFDANGRYDSRERLMRMVEHLDRIGALEQTVLLEEPFAEDSGIDVHDIPVRIAADESAHCMEDAYKLIKLGYGAMALKPIAKTLSVSLQVAQCAQKMGIPCFCADLTVNPLMVDWNKNVAAGLTAIPGLKVGVLESNGSQNYPDWVRLKNYHPMATAPWVDAKDGLFTLNDEFYRTCGGVLLNSQHYMELARDC